MNTPPEKVPRPPEALVLALAQMHAALESNGAEELKKVFAEKDGYAQLVWILEKLCKCALDWQEYCHPRAGTKSGQSAGDLAGLSNESLREAEERFEGK